jgi:hypothetical protein
MTPIDTNRFEQPTCADESAKATHHQHLNTVREQLGTAIREARERFRRIYLITITVFASISACAPAVALEQCKTGFGSIRSVSNVVAPNFINSPAPRVNTIWPATARPYAPNPETIGIYVGQYNAIRYYPERDRATSPMYQRLNGAWVLYTPETNPADPQRNEIRPYEFWETPCINAQGTVSFHFYGMVADRCAALLSNDGPSGNSRRFFVLRADGVDPRYSEPNLSFGHIIDRISYRGGSDMPPGSTVRTYTGPTLNNTISLENKFLLCELDVYGRPNTIDVPANENFKGYLIVVDKATAMLKAGFRLSTAIAATTGVPNPIFVKKWVRAWSDADASRSAITFNVSFFDCADDPRSILNNANCFPGIPTTTISHALKTNGIIRATGHGERNLLRSFSWGSANNPPAVKPYNANSVTLSESTPVPLSGAEFYLSDQQNAIVGWAPNQVPRSTDTPDRLNFAAVGPDRLCFFIGGLQTRALVRAMLTQAGCPGLTQQVQFDGGGSSALSVRDLNGVGYDLLRAVPGVTPGGIQITEERAVPVVLHIN